MDAPLYPPSSAWEEPVRLAQPLSVSRSSMAEFMADPEGWAILRSEVRGLDNLVAIPQLKPHLSNLSPLAMTQFGGVSLEALKRVEAKLQARPGGRK